MSYIGTKPGNSTVILDGSVTTSKIADNAITVPKIGYAGAVLQVVQAVKTDTFTTSSTSFVDVTGLSVSITPTSTSSKILVFYSTSMGINRGDQYSGGLRLVRNSTAIYVGDASGSRIQASNWAWGYPTVTGYYCIFTLSGSFLDSPATTSATTYKLQAASGYTSETVSINRDGRNDNFSGTGVVPSQITVMEIEG